VAVPAGQTALAVDFGRVEVFDAVEGEQVTACMENVSLQDLVALSEPKDVAEDRPDLVGRDGIEDGAHLGIAGDALQAKYRPQVVIAGTPLEGEQGGIFEGEHGQGRHQGVRQGEGRLTPLVRQPCKTLAGTSHQGIKMQVPAQPSSGVCVHGASSNRVRALGVPPGTG